MPHFHSFGMNYVYLLFERIGLEILGIDGLLFTNGYIKNLAKPNATEVIIVYARLQNEQT